MRVFAPLILVALWCGAVVYAAEPPAAQKPATPAATETPPAAKPPADTKAAEAKPSDESADAAKQEKQDKADEKSAPTAKPPGDQKASPQRFVPSEQVRADFDVSFPIDI